jgi:D-sedoheptulose 7-phosphate isomerase
MEDRIKASFEESLNLLKDFCDHQENFKKTLEISKLIANAFKKDNKVIIAGNGGSACDAIHFAQEFTGRFRKDRKSLPVISLTDPAHITAVANDLGFENVFSRGIEAYGQKGDIFIGLSTSGNSLNVLKAVEIARKKGLKTIALLGRDGGQLKGKADFEFIIPGKTADKVQEVHMTILHIIIEGVERLLFPENYC